MNPHSLGIDYKIIFSPPYNPTPLLPWIGVTRNSCERMYI